MKLANIGIAMLGDERRAVMERLESACMERMHRLTKIIEDNVKYRDGSSPKVITAPKVVSSVKDSKEVGEYLVREGVKILILQYYIWDYPYLVWPLVNIVGKDKPILNVSNNEGEYPGNVGLLATDGALRQSGLKTHRIIGDIEDPKIQKEIIEWVKAAEAYVSLRGQVYGMYGGHSMGMETGYFHLVPIQRTFGVTTYQIDQLWLAKEMENVDPNEVEKGFKWLSEMLGERIKYDGKMLTPEKLKQQIKLYLAMRKVNEEWGFDFCGIKGQRDFTRYVVITDVAEMLMNDPYDWNGPKEPFVCATEADSLGALTMQILKYIGGGMPVLFADVRLYVPDKDIWIFANSGNHPSWYAALSDDPKENFKKVTLYPAIEMYFPAGGASVEFDAAPGEMTFARLGLRGDEFFMVIVKGESLDLPEEERRELREQTNPTWPHMYVKLSASYEEFINVFPANHIHGIPGDHVKSLVRFCEIAGVKPIVLGKEGKELLPPLWEIMK
ncbi:MAG: L-fucose/L-arabinose isomerase family protein [Thermoprotei archaeon]|nr:L-fucose/L-arabinose isomerase family protein [Thermoprotei archaeon]